MLQGRVVDPDGKPHPRARIFLGWYWETRDEKPAALRTTSGPDGRFRFRVDKAFFQRLGNRELEPWNDARLLAVVPGSGLGLSDSREPDASHGVTLRLVRDDVLITGRVINLEGRPVPGAVLRFWSVKASPAGDMGPWLREIQEGKEVGYALDQKHLPVEVYFSEQEGPIAPARTDRDGRFRIDGMGHERQAKLKLDGLSVRSEYATVMTRRGSAIRVRDSDSKTNPSYITYHGASATLTAAPGRIVEGTVRSLDTGSHLSGRR